MSEAPVHPRSDHLDPGEIIVRPFRRGDREALTALVNDHIGAVLPGASVSVNTVLGSLERRPQEFVTDPWVTERLTLVATQGTMLVAAAHLLRYAASGDVGVDYRDAGEILWCLHRPLAPRGNPHWCDATTAGELLLRTCLDVLTRWHVTRVLADGTLPAPACYGVPEQWTHIERLLRAAGFAPARRETVLVADVARLPPMTDDVRVVRTVGMVGTRLTITDADDHPLGYVEIDTDLGGHERLARHGGWADVGNLEVHPDAARPGREVVPLLLAAARDWLALAGCDRLLAYVDDGDDDDRHLASQLTDAGFRVLTRTGCAWRLRLP